MKNSNTHVTGFYPMGHTRDNFTQLYLALPSTTWYDKARNMCCVV